MEVGRDFVFNMESIIASDRCIILLEALICSCTDWTHHKFMENKKKGERGKRKEKKEEKKVEKRIKKVVMIPLIEHQLYDLQIHQPIKPHHYLPHFHYLKFSWD